MEKSMANGVQQWVNAALDVKDDLCQKLLNAGIPAEHALKASSLVVKAEVAKQLEAKLKNKPAAQITSQLKVHSEQNPLQH